MFLTLEEKAMLNGEHGEATRIAMEVVVKLGQVYKAKRLVPINLVHSDSLFYIGQGQIEFLETMATKGARISVPTTTNAAIVDLRRSRETHTPEEFIGYNERIEAALRKIGVAMSCTCAPYYGGLVPRFGDIICSSESNVIAYYNSAIGARANRSGALLDICCAVVGRVPEFGMLLDENRKAKIVMRCEGFTERMWLDDMTYTLLGYVHGAHVKDQVGVMVGVNQHMTQDQLRNYSASVASSGSAALFHIVGVTPEAATLEQCQGLVEKEVIVTPADLEAAKRKLWTGKRNDVDLVIMGCPHMSYPELDEIVKLFDGRKVREGVQMWLMTNRTIYTLIADSGVLDGLQAAGIRVFTDGCCLEYNQSHYQFKSLMTNSAKMANYSYGRLGIDISIGNLETCVNSALTGRIA